MGEPSSGILMLNFCVSEMTADREERTALALFELRAARARRFYENELLRVDMCHQTALPLDLP